MPAKEAKKEDALLPIKISYATEQRNYDLSAYRKIGLKKGTMAPRISSKCAVRPSCRVFGSINYVGIRRELLWARERS